MFRANTAVQTALSLIFIASLAVGLPPQSAPVAEKRPIQPTAKATQGSRATLPLLLVDPDFHPNITVSWTDSEGTLHEHSGDRPYRVDAERTPLGGNIACYAAVGGSRLVKGAGHPSGAVVRTGFYKIDNARPFFGGITEETEITVVYRGLRFNQPVGVHAASIVQHLKYDRGEMQACGLPGDAREQFNLVSPTDTLNERVKPGIDTRLGVLDGSADASGSGDLRVEDDGSVTMTLTFRYPVLRNLRDPWKSDLPGTFLEPYHFHVEFEVLPEGTPPLGHTVIRAGTPRD